MWHIGLTCARFAKGEPVVKTVEAEGKARWDSSQHTVITRCRCRAFGVLMQPGKGIEPRWDRRCCSSSTTKYKEIMWIAGTDTKRLDKKPGEHGDSCEQQLEYAKRDGRSSNATRAPFSHIQNFWHVNERSTKNSEKKPGRLQKKGDSHGVGFRVF
jgi:hypothetical protein